MRKEGVNVRSSRSRRSATSPAARKEKVKKRVEELIKGGANYHPAWEQAEREVAL